MTTIKKRITLNLSEEDLRILHIIQNSTKEGINATFRKALFFYYLKNFEAKDKK